MRRCTGGLVNLLCLLLLTGCTGGHTSTGAPGAKQTSTDLITREQILYYRHAYQAVEALRARWLHARGPDSFQNPSEVRVYHDDVQIGGVGALRTISTREIAYILYYDGVSASARWGLGHGAGVIYVSTFLGP